MKRPSLTEAAAVVVGLCAASWTGLPAGPAGRLLAVAAGLTVLAAARWRPAATLAGCLLVATIAADDLTTPAELNPISLAFAASVLTLYLVLVDAAPTRPPRWLVPAAAAAAAIAATTGATQLPTRAWMAPLGMAAAATAFIVSASSLRPPAAKSRPRTNDDDSG